MNMPIAIFVGVEGSQPLSSNQRQNQMSGNVSVTTQNGLIAWATTPVIFHGLGSASQNISVALASVTTFSIAVQSVFLFAQYVMVDPFWWNTIQKTMTMRKMTR